MKNKELETLITEYESIIERCKDLTTGLIDEQLNWRPAPDKWSIAECIRHLVITNDLYYQNAKPVIDKALQKGKLSDNPIKLGIIGKIFMGFEPPPKRKFKVPKVFSPKNDPHTIYSFDVVSEFINSKNKMIDLIKMSDGLDMNKVKLSSPVTNLIKVRLGEYFKVMAPHDRRHLWQAENAKNSDNFPTV